MYSYYYIYIFFCRKQRSPSMYKRFSSHLTSMDLPDLPELPDAFRETASRVESALQSARNSYEERVTKKGDSKDSDDKDSSRVDSFSNSDEIET